MKDIDQRIDAALKIERLTREERYTFPGGKNENIITSQQLSEIAYSLQILTSHLRGKDIEEIIERWCE